VERAGVDYPNKPFVFFAWGADFDEFKNKMEETGRTVVFPTPDRAIKALAHLADYAELCKSQSI
jgi:acyl-CoA synthetase (NDP forming)